MLGYISSFAAVGFGVRCYQLAIMKRNIFDNLGGHALSVAAFTGLGYYLYHAEERQRGLIEDKKAQLLRMRARETRLAEEYAASMSEEEHH
ncbi:BZ3500_MvSof-1268-A1-R1_Chr2-3g05286 [Microbotryum saponariae]|uniref:BZ3500_MvSof-1268-A1-R1_Chr2-3g05286 protein n=1 Tax=Microbotryum saponariae TaxID=289078 RepID=A0A2X0L7Y2_9BASI|nr:BZ3500_MvSof-1268-A1-R1_Chr2-3g05286 [Microbotryum saponariae]SDA01120.1 BZ3501_MvSof-1269-A2-R1_Chr2-2g04959 [Microbotryum saponariae]